MAESQTTNWPARFAALEAADGEEWDRLDKQIEADWKWEYQAAFLDIAVARGWGRENAETWAGAIVDDAFMEARPAPPRAAAEADVRETEMEVANA